MAKTILWFSASYCSPCRAMQPAMDAIAEETPYDKIMIDGCEDGLEVARQWQVSSVPTIILLDNSTELARVTGQKTESQLREFIDAHSYEDWVKANGEKPVLVEG